MEVVIFKHYSFWHDVAIRDLRSLVCLICTKEGWILI